MTHFDPYELYKQQFANQEKDEPEPAGQEPVEPVVTEEVPAASVEVEDPFKDVFLKDEWIPRNVPENELPDWYKTKYIELAKQVGGGQFKETIIENLREQLLAEIESVEDFKKHYVGFTQNPALYAAQHFPEALAKIGVEPVLNEQQIFEAVEKEMQKTFGENYESMIDPSQALKLGSYSYKLVQKQKEIYDQIVQKNEENKNIYNSLMQAKQAQLEPVKQISEEELIQHSKNEFSKFKTKVGTEEEFLNFVRDSYKNNWLPSMEEIWTMKNLNTLS